MPTRLTDTEAVMNFSDAAVPVRIGELPAILEELPHLEPDDADRFASDLDSGRSAAGPLPPVPWVS
ncbi:MAG: hypothetical protein A2Z07_07795 [Armatimonadetes bacterium RBG_16_67_12]|nr:MAG: hypothetical protein A2Z07_07795 [Armatimonadetes bacterium RBG_16_67_12]